MDSFIRFYDQHETYFGSFGAGDREDAPTPFTPAWDAWAKKNHKGRDKKSYFTQLKTEACRSSTERLLENMICSRRGLMINPVIMTPM